MPRNIDEVMLDINLCIQKSIIKYIEAKPIEKMKPWISQKTLDLIKQRAEFRSKADY